MKLDELERRLAREPDNLGLRVLVAGLMREAGRNAEAVELYRSVAVVYRDQGRAQQAIAVCRSILELAPADTACTALLADLQRGQSEPQEPMRRSSLDETPLPFPVPFHIHDPTSEHSLLGPADLDLAAEVDTRQLSRVSTDEVDKLDELTAPGPRQSEDLLTPLPDVPTGELDKLEELTAPGARHTPQRLTPVPIARDSDSDLRTEPHLALPVRPSDEDVTRPRDLPLPDETEPG